MKALKANATILDLRHLTEETLQAYGECKLNAVFALTNPQAQALLTRYGVKLNVVQSINCEDDVEVNTINGKATLDGKTSVSEKKRAMVINGKLYVKPEGVKALEQYCGIVINGKLYCPESLASAVIGKCIVNGKICAYPDDAVILNSTTRLDRGFLFRAQPKLYWAEKMFIAVDPKLNAEALAAKGAKFAAPKAILTESNAETLAPLFTDDTELVVLPEDVAVIEDDIELKASARRRYGKRLYVMGDVTVDEDAGDTLENIEYLHVNGSVLLPEKLEEQFDRIPDVEYEELRLLSGHAIVGKPMLRLGKEMLDLYPDGVTCADCAMVMLDAALEPDTIAKKFIFDGCAMVKCTALQENAVNAVSKDVARVQVADKEEEKDEKDVKLNGIQLTL